MKNFTSYSALILLLLFARVMTPNELLLQLHAHEHTVEQPHSEDQTHIGQKHTHCQTDDLFHAPFQPAEPIVLPVFIAHIPQYSALSPQDGFAALALHSYLRGPPAHHLS